MTTYSWKTATSGDWATAGSWTPSGPPNDTSADAVIGLAGSYTATVAYGSTYTLDSLKVSGTGATLDVQGTLTLAGAKTVTVSAGTLLLDSYGTIKGATISRTGGTIALSGGTLDGVTYRGTLDLSADSSNASLANGITLTGTAGTGAGAIKLTGSSSRLYVMTSTTLDNATISIGNAAYLYSYVSAGTLTLGSHLTVQQVAAANTYAYLYDAYGDGSLVNFGTITSAASANALYVQGFASFANKGLISVGNGGSLYEQAGSFSNTGTINVTGGSYLSLGGSWSNSGKIAVTGSTIDLAGTFSAASLSALTLSSATVDILGQLVNTGATLSVGTSSTLGTLTVAGGGTITGGVVKDAGGGLIFGGGTLDGVTYRGTLDLSADSSSASLANGITLTGTAGTGAGAIKLTGSSSRLYVMTSTTLDNATISIGNGAYLYNYVSAGTLTLGSHLTVREVSSSYGYAYLYDAYSTGTLVNLGTITSTASANALYVQGFASFANKGLISVGNGGSLYERAGTFSNTGTINVTGGSYLSLGGSWSNSGKIAVTGSTIDLAGTFSAASLSTLTLSSATVDILGQLVNTGATLSVGTGSTLGMLTVESGGTITGGVVKDAGGGLIFSGGTLDGVTYRGTLDLSAASSALSIINGITLTGSAGTGAGSVVVGDYADSAYSSLYVYGATTLDNAAITLSYGYLYHYESSGNGDKLTFGSGLTVQDGGYAYLYDSSSSGGGIVNKGTISAGVNGGRFVVAGGTFTNQGLISVANGDSLDLSGTAFSNLSGTTLTGGSIFVDAGSIVQLASDAVIASDKASITLSGVASLIEAYSSATGQQSLLDSTLRTVGTGGTLALLNGRSFTAVASGGTFTVNGVLRLDSGGSFAATVLSLSGGTITGNGTASGAVKLSGAASITGGTITLGGTINGTGTISIAAGATAILASGGTVSGNVLVAGTLALSGKTFNPTAVTISAGGAVAGFGTLGGTVTDSSLLDASGGTLTVAGLAGISSGRWSGVGLQADAASVLKLAPGTTIAIDAGSITLSGTGSLIGAANSTTNTTFVSLDSTLASIAAGGTLTLLNGRAFTAVAAAGTFTNGGVLALGTATFGAKSLLLTAGASVSGTGTITAPVVVTGAVGLNGGTLAITGQVSGTGTLNVAAGEALLLSGNTLAATTVVAATGTVAGFGAVTGSLTNTGLLDAIGGTLSATGLLGLASGTLSAGQIEADAGSVLQLGNNIAISTVAGGITLSGTGSVIESLNTTTAKQVLLDSTLATIAAGGTLAVLAGRSLTAVANAGTFTDSGLLVIDGGAFKATKLVVTATGTLLDNGGFTGAISNAGTVSIADGTILTLTSGGALGGTFSGAGTLQLTGATAFTVAASTTLTAGLLQVASGALLSGAGTILAPLDVVGTVVASSGTLIIAGPLSSSGTLSVAVGATLRLADGGTFFGAVTGAGAVINADAVLGTAAGLSLAGSGTLSVSNLLGGEISAGAGDGVVLKGGVALVANAGAIGGTRHGLTLGGSSATVTNSGLISGDTGAAILGSGPGTISITNTGLIVNYEGVGVAAISLSGAASATVTNAGTIIGGYYLDHGQSAIQFGSGNDRLIVLAGAAFLGTVRGGGGANTLELAIPSVVGAVGTLSGLGSAFQSFSSIVEDAAAAWVLADANTLSATTTVSLASGANLTIAGTLTAAAGATVSGAGTIVVGATGTLAATGSGTVAIGANLANLAGGVLTGGTFGVSAGSTLQLSASVTTDSATILISGAGGTIKGATGSALAQSLGTIGSAGTLSLSNGGSFVSTGVVSDLGLLSLTDAVFGASTLSVGASGMVIGTGTINGTIADAGLIEASGGTLTLSGTVTGSGTVGIDADSVLYAGGKMGATNIVFLDSGGGLVLAQPNSATGTISGFSTSDSIDLLGAVVTSQTFVSNVLTLKGAAGTLATLHFAGDYSGYVFGFFADGHGGSNIVLT